MEPSRIMYTMGMTYLNKASKLYIYLNSLGADMQHECEYCGKLCTKNQVRALCSLKCRLLGNIDKKGDCWLWKGKKNSWKYGEIMVNGHRYPAHRVSYELFVGPIENDKIMLHLCDMPPCINPQHLSPGTDLENSQDMVKKGRSLTGLKNVIHQKDKVVKKRSILSDVIAKIKGGGGGSF